MVISNQDTEEFSCNWLTISSVTYVRWLPVSIKILAFMVGICVSLFNTPKVAVCMMNLPPYDISSLERCQRISFTNFFGHKPRWWFLTWPQWKHGFSTFRSLMVFSDKWNTFPSTGIFETPYQENSNIHQSSITSHRMHMFVFCQLALFHLIVNSLLYAQTLVFPLFGNSCCYKTFILWCH